MAPSSSKLPPLPSRIPSPDKISKETILELSSAYPVAAARFTREAHRAYVTKDKFRFEELPALITKRRGKAPKGGESQWTSGWLEKGDLERLMDWKLHRGTYRPSLPGLIRSNPAEQVVRETAAALAQLELSLSANPPEFPKAALKTAASLRGVGPATASLILAAAEPQRVPFMADELYKWFTGHRPEKYNDKELQLLWDHVVTLRKRLPDVEAADVEKAIAVVAWGRDGKVEGWNEDGDKGEEGEHEGERKEAKAGKGQMEKAEKVRKMSDKKRKVDVSEDEDESKEKTKSKANKKQSAKTTKKRRGS